MPEQTFYLSHPEAPKSLNAGGVGARTHWGNAHRQKKEWAGIWLAELLVKRVPKHMEHVRIGATMYWKNRPPAGRNRDVDNYIPGLLKPLQDCLVKAGYVADDTPEFVTFTALTFSTFAAIPDGKFFVPPMAKALTIVVLSASYPEARA